MKFKVSQMSIKNGTAANGKSWTMYNFTNMYDGHKYSCFAQAGYTDNFSDGYEFEADMTEKPNPKGGTFKNVQWPKVQRGAPAPYQPSNTQITDAVKIQLDRIEKKLDRLNRLLSLGGLKDNNHEVPEDIKLPFEGDPAPTDEDRPF